MVNFVSAMASSIFKKLAEGLGSLIKEKIKPAVQKATTPKETAPTSVDDIDVFSKELVPVQKELVPTEQQVEERLSFEELQKIKAIKRDSAALQLDAENKPLQKIVPKDETYVPDTSDTFTNLGKIQDFKKNTTSIVPRSSVLRQQIIAHPKNEPLTADEWVKWIKRRMNKSVNSTTDARLDKMDLSIKQQEIDDSNLFKTQGQLNQEIIEDLTTMDDPQIVYALDKLRQRFGVKQMDEYVNTLKKQLKTEIATGKKDKIVGGYLKAAQDRGVKLSKRDLVNLVENNPLYHVRATHLRYLDNQEKSLEKGIETVEDAYMTLQKLVDKEFENIASFIRNDKRFKKVTGKDAQGRDVSGYTEADTANIRKGLDSYLNGLARISRHISITDGLHKHAEMPQELIDGRALNYNKLNRFAQESGYTPMDYLSYVKMFKTTGGKLRDDHRATVERAVKQTIEDLKRRSNNLFDMAYNKGAEIPKSTQEFPDQLLKAFKTVRKNEDKLFDSYMKASDQRLAPAYRSYASYAIGGEDRYGEIILNLPEHTKGFFNALENKHNHFHGTHLSRTNSKNVEKGMERIAGQTPGKMPSTGNEMTRLQVNPLYFSRYTTQKMANGDSILMINELQGDFSQALRELKRQGQERINPFNAEFFTKTAETGLEASNIKVNEIRKRLDELDDLRVEQGLLTDTQSKQYKELLLDALVEEKVMRKTFSGRSDDILKNYQESGQAKSFPYLPLSSMQGISDHSVKTYAKLAANEIPDVTHIGVYPVEFLHGRKRGMNKNPNWIQYGGQDGAAGYKKPNGETVGLPNKKSTIVRAMEKFAKQYGVKLEKKEVARSDPDKPFKLVFVKGAQESSDFRRATGEDFLFPNALDYREHFAAYKTEEEAVRAYRSFKKFFEGDMGDLTVVKIDKLKNGRPNPDLYDEFLALPIPNDMLDLPTTGYFKGGLVRSGFRW